MKIERIHPDGSKEQVEWSAVNVGDVIECKAGRLTAIEIDYDGIEKGQRFRGVDGKWRYRDEYARQKADCLLNPDSDPFGSEGIMMSIDLHSPGQHKGKKVFTLLAE